MNSTDYGSIESNRGFEDGDQECANRCQRLNRHVIMSLAITTIFLLAMAMPLVSIPAELVAENITVSGHQNEYVESTSPMSSTFPFQKVDHFKHDGRTFSNRFYSNDEYFTGPGSPIFVVLGGEDALDGLLYPFIYDRLAKRFGALTLGIEHRFYGTSRPIKNPSPDELRELMTPQQAMLDVIELVQWKRAELGCSLDRSSTDYCPIMTVGGSYPGFMSAVLRIQHPDVIDIGYAASAPMKLYSHTVPKDAYFDKVTAVAEEAVPGCADSVRSALLMLNDYMKKDAGHKSVKDFAKELGICPQAIPTYILKARDSIAMLLRETNAIIASHMAEANMDYYPPTDDTELVQACHIFANNEYEFKQKVAKFLNMRQDWWDVGCFDMHSELPSGKRATISSTDWSGMGDGESATMWEILTCQLLPQCSISSASMFYPREWTYEFVRERCETRFGLTPDLKKLVRDLRFDDLSNVTRLLFTNGLRDGWAVASVLESPVEGVTVINMVNGAHHSDLMHGPTDDTPDVVFAHNEIEAILQKWLSQRE